MDPIKQSADTTTTDCSNSSAGGMGDQAQAAAAADPTACMIHLLLPDTIIKILKLLWDAPASIIAFSLTCSQAQQLCSDGHLWVDLCRIITDTLPSQPRSVDWSPSAWNVGSHRELYIRLLQPYRPLLQQRVWHTTKMPAGQLLVVDALPPYLALRSVFFRSLQGRPFIHDVFWVELPSTSKEKAEVLCCLCGASSVTLGFTPYALMSAHERNNSLSPVIRRQLASHAPAAAAPMATAATGAAAAAATVSTDGTGCTQPAAGSNPSSLSQSPADAGSTLVLSACCKAQCGKLYLEIVNRWNGRWYPNNAARSQAGSSAASSSAGGAGSNGGDAGSSAGGAGAASGAGAADLIGTALAQAAAAPEGPYLSEEQSVTAPGPHDDSRAAGDGSSSGSGSGVGLLPLPDVVTYPESDAADNPMGLLSASMWDLLDNQTDCGDYSAEWRSQAVYAPFTPSPWLQPCIPTPLSAGQASFTAPAGRASSSGSMLPSGSCQPATPTPPAAAAAPAAEALTGLWRGTYGAHGVELVLLQLLQVPLGYDMWQQHRLPQPPPRDLADCLQGLLLLQALLHQPGATAGHLVGAQGEQGQEPVAGSSSSSALQPSLHPATEAAAAAVLEPDSTDALQEHGQAPSAAAAVAGASEGAADSSRLHQQQQQPDSSHLQQQQRQQHEGEEGCAYQAQQLLLVGSKVTGDRNVPAGQVTFAVDLGSRSTVGAGRLLQLPPGVHTVVEVNGPGTRPLVVKERYHGMAQIADSNFKNPKVTPVELIVFEDPACFGVLWATPMHNVSFFVRQTGLP